MTSDASKTYPPARSGSVRRVSRREFLHRTAAVGVSGALANALPSGPALSQTPKRGGHLVIGMSDAQTNLSLDPTTFVAWYQMLAGSQFYNLLAEADQHGQPQPCLAESWEPRAGGKEWVFKIRRGVTFSNGKDLTAADVVYSINRHRSPTTKSAAKALLKPIVDIKATDAHEVTISLNSVFVDLPSTLTDLHLLIGPEGSDFTDAVGTGPFLKDSVEMGVRVTLTRNPNYWRSGQPYVDSVEILGINDATARIAALLSGKAHLIDSVPPKTVSLFAGKEGFKVHELGGAAEYYFPMRCDRAPFDNLDVRLALKYAVDRKLLLDKILLGHGQIGNDIPVPSFDPFFAADIPQRPYDPDKAKFHIKKSGYTGSFVLSASEAPFTGAVDAAVVMSSSAGKAGIDIQVDREPTDGYWDNVWMQKPWCVSSINGRPTIDALLTTFYQSDASWNETFWKRPAFDKLLAEARGELDVPRRKQMYHDLQKMIYEDGGNIIPLFPNWLDAASTKVQGYYQIPTLFMSGLRAPERVWFET
jgi:peptide/nickel transport system substrate-binding protein